MAEPADPSLLARYRAFSVGDISDAVGRLYTMQTGIRPLYEPIARLVGIALTVKAPPGDNWAVHGAMALSRKDDVLVIDWQGYCEGSGSGETNLQAPIRRGLAGVVIDGSWRDVQDLQALGFPLFGRGIAPFSPAKAAFGEINVPVSCGGVIVEPGDIVVADAEGAVVVPHAFAADVADALDELLAGMARAKSAPPVTPSDAMTPTARRYFEAVREAEARLKRV